MEIAEGRIETQRNGLAVVCIIDVGGINHLVFIADQRERFFRRRSAESNTGNRPRAAYTVESIYLQAKSQVTFDCAA